jgi:serine/threonine protein kinase
VAGRYQLERRLGQGAMGIVYRAVDIELGREVALKTLPAMSAESSVRLRQEARAMAGVSHPNIAVLYGIERWNGMPVLVEEYMSHGTLAARLSKPLDIGEVIAVGAGLAAGLAALHDRSLIHRDIKPSNVGFSDRDEAKVLDFGLADACPGTPSDFLGDDPGSAITRPSLAGTPRYLPPEAWRGEPVGSGGDLWALAMVLYECLTGAHPLVGSEPRLWVDRLASLPAPARLRSDCPVWLSDLVAQGLSVKAAARWPSAAWVHTLLVRSGDVRS